MNRHEYKGYWFEIIIDSREDDEEEMYFYVPFIEHPNKGGVEQIDDYVTYEEAKLGAEKHIDMLIAASESEVNFLFNEPEAWGSSIIDY